MGTVTDLTKYRLRIKPMQYTVMIEHTDTGIIFTIEGVQDSSKARLAVARDLCKFALSIRNDCRENPDIE